LEWRYSHTVFLPGFDVFPEVFTQARILNITENGVCTLLKKRDPTKANGPDQIPTRILKEACNEIAPFLTIILRQSLGVF
jgi:hypothetical protein